MASTEAERPKRPDDVVGIAVDGEFHDPTTWAPPEFRDLRDLVRFSTGYDDIVNPWTDPRVSEHDLWPAVIYIVRRRKKKDYTFEQAEKLLPAEWERMETDAVTALLEQRAADDEGDGPPPKARARKRAGSSA